VNTLLKEKVLSLVVVTEQNSGRKKTYLKRCVQNWAKSANGGHEKDLHQLQIA
jgi:hypothetical protein